MSCGYQGYEFGARYMDSICIDGILQDADSDYDTAAMGTVIPCPQCCELAAMDYYADENIENLDARWPRYHAWHLVMDIRRNRGLQSVSLLRFAFHRIVVEFIPHRKWSTMPTYWHRDWLFRLRRWFV